MSDWLTELTSEHVRDLVPYESARRLFTASEGQARVWLNANESPESSEFAISSELLNRYPDCQPTDVVNAYAQYAGVNSEQIVVTRGADEGIELLVRAFCSSARSSIDGGETSDKILICPPTYGMYAISAQTFNIGVEKVPLLEDFSLDIANICQHVGKVKLVFLCSPNNPTGTVLPQADIEKVLNAFSGKAIVVLDEAYIEFSAHTSQQALLQKYEHLVILRTLSKGFALAGIRCGFMLSSPSIKQILLKVIAPYPIPDPVAQIAEQALNEQGLNAMRARVEYLQAELVSLSATLSSIESVELVGSQCGNFVLFKSQHNPQLMQYLVDNNMLIRDQSKQMMLENCLRISIGTVEQNKQLLALITTFFADMASSISTSAPRSTQHEVNS
jgi:histidinol-phosphate aminotransferase